MGLLLITLAAATRMAMPSPRPAVTSRSPSGTSIAGFSNVVWSDPEWKSDGTGAMPIGNGDVTSSVWVDENTGDLRLLLSKSDVFDENSQPVKTGVLRLTFDPPLWQKPSLPRAAPPPGPARPLECTRGATFCQSLNIATSTVTIRTPAVEVSVFVDLTQQDAEAASRHHVAGVVHVTAVATAAATAGFGLKVMLESYRQEGKEIVGRVTDNTTGYCYPRFEHADTVVSGVKDEIQWYHWNHINTSFQNDTMRNQGVFPELHPELEDIYTNRVWGGRVRGDGLSGRGGLTLTGQGLQKVDAQVTLLTLPDASPATWIAELGKVVPTAPLPSAGCGSLNKAAWTEIMDRSYIEVTAASGSATEMVKTANSITDHVNWDRYLSLIQGRVAFSPIKFNGQAFNCNNTGLGWDSREWGAAYWWQNTRQPYYNALAQGDFDTMRSFLDFYLRMLPYVRARTIAQFKGTDNPLNAGALYEETSTAFGMYQPKDWGCSTATPAPDGASRNDFIRFHWTGGLELSLMVLDHYDATHNISDLRRYLPMAAEVVEAYRQRFPHTDSNGKTDMWPAQALETYQCLQPGSRFQCITNPSTDIAGLMSVLPKLIALPSSSGATAAQRDGWQAQLGRLPPLPQGPAADNATHRPPPVNAHKLYPVSQGWGFNQTQDQSTGWPGWGSRRNGENTDLYPVHPFRIFGMGKATDISLAQQTYTERHDPCNTGWCQDIIQAAMLNMTTDATTQLIARASSSDHGGFRFEGFAGHYQDYEPSLDHYGFMRTGLDYMLLAPVDDTKRSVLLFPTFPTSQFNVRFKLHAPKNTTIEASCQGGQLEYLVVTPPERRADVTVMNCDTPALPPLPPPASRPRPSMVIWVDCERGKDSNNGSAGTPFATLRRARDYLRATRAHHGTDTKARVQAVVNVVAGRVCRSYEQAEPGQPQNMSLVLDHRDSNTLWQAKAVVATTEVGGAVLSGGVPIDATDLRPLSPAEKLWFKPNAANKIMALSLSDTMDDLGSIKALSYAGGDACIRSDFFEAGGVELYKIVSCSNSNSNSSDSTCGITSTATAYSDATSKLPNMRMARWPDLVEPPVPDNWADYHDPNNTNLAITVNVTAAQLRAWTNQVQQGGPEIWSHGLWKYNWADSHRQVLSVKNASTAASGPAARLGLHHGDFPDRDCQLSAAKTGAQGGHVYVYNALWELDSIGEYVVDHHAKMVFLYAGNTSNTSTEHEVSVATTLLTVNNAINISWVGLSFRGSRGAGIVLRNCTDLVVADGAVSDCGTTAFNVSGGARCGLLNMQVSRAGTGGAILEGGDRQTLAPGAHFVRGSHLRDSNRWLMNYAPLVLMAGVGQRVENSVLSEGPQMAVFVQGNSHQLLNSTIRDVMQQCNDCSAYYFGRDWTYRGMIISGCNFSLAGPMWDSSNAMTNAIYADDYASSVIISHNAFYLGGNIQTVFMSNGGRDHAFTENVVNPLPPYSDGTGNSPRVDIENYGCGGNVGPYACAACTTGGARLQAQFLNRVPFNSSDPWKTMFPEMYRFWETLPCEPGGVLVKDNAVCFKGQTIGQPIHATGSVVANNSWVPSVCGGPGPRPPPPSPPSPPPTPLDVVEAHVGCGLLTSAQQLYYNRTNGAIYLTAGKSQGEVVAVSWATGGANGSPVNINPVDVDEFQRYKNVVFDIIPPPGRRYTTSVEIKLRVNGKCLTAPQKLPGQVTLEPCALGVGSKWGMVTVGATAKETFVLSSNAGGCVVNDHPEPPMLRPAPKP